MLAPKQSQALLGCKLKLWSRPGWSLTTHESCPQMTSQALLMAPPVLYLFHPAC